jgi:hypothetical protein
MGRALEDKDSFVRFLVRKKDRKILGCHIIGSQASILIHEVIVAMKSNEGLDTIVILQEQFIFIQLYQKLLQEQLMIFREKYRSLISCEYMQKANTDFMVIHDSKYETEKERSPVCFSISFLVCESSVHNQNQP